MALARLVESDKGELLSPKIAPERIVPATNAGFKPINVPTPINATPTVDNVVNALPINVPTMAEVNKAVGKRTGDLAF